jgi:phosphatidylserine/phosphatidylglycerophosphate/cardiolipin synthase-like enzyme
LRILSVGQLLPKSPLLTLNKKCAIADEPEIFLSSANLTDSGLGINMELGIRIAGGLHAAVVERHFDELIRLGELIILG